MTGSLPSRVLVAAAFAFIPLVASAQQGQGPALPEGDGKELVETVCTLCHQTNMITQSSGYTREGWKELISTMIDLSGMPDSRPRSPDIWPSIFAPKYNKRAAKLVPGPLQIVVQGMGHADARPALARSDPGGRRIDLVGRPVRQSDRAA